jgi:hypothetical protein
MPQIFLKFLYMNFSIHKILKFHYRLHKSPPRCTSLSHTNPLHTLTSYFFSMSRICLSIPNRFLHRGFPFKTLWLLINSGERYKATIFPYNRPWRLRGGEEVQLYPFFNLGARWCVWLTQRPGRFTPRKVTRFTFYRRLCGPQGRSGRVRKNPPPFCLNSYRVPYCHYNVWLTWDLRSSGLLRRVNC